MALICNLTISCCIVGLCGGVQFVSMLGTKGSVGKCAQHRKVLGTFQGSLSLLSTVYFSIPLAFLQLILYIYLQPKKIP